MKYRTLTERDRIQFGDLFETWLESDKHFLSSDGKYKHYIGKHGTYCGSWRRPVGIDNWISFKDRQPTEADAYDGKRGRAGNNYAGKIMILFEDGSMGLHSWETGGNEREHWMPLAFDQDIPVAPVIVDGRTLVPLKDGSVKISCGTVIPKIDVDELFRQREAAMGK